MGRPRSSKQQKAACTPRNEIHIRSFRTRLACCSIRLRERGVVSVERVGPTPIPGKQTKGCICPGSFDASGPTKTNCTPFNRALQTLLLSRRESHPRAVNQTSPKRHMLKILYFSKYKFYSSMCTLYLRYDKPCRNPRMKQKNNKPSRHKFRDETEN